MSGKLLRMRSSPKPVSCSAQSRNKSGGTRSPICPADPPAACARSQSSTGQVACIRSEGVWQCGAVGKGQPGHGYIRVNMAAWLTACAGSAFPSLVKSGRVVPRVSDGGYRCRAHPTTHDRTPSAGKGDQRQQYATKSKGGRKHKRHMKVSEHIAHTPCGQLVAWTGETSRMRTKRRAAGRPSWARSPHRSLASSPGEHRPPWRCWCIQNIRGHVCASFCRCCGSKE